MPKYLRQTGVIMNLVFCSQKDFVDIYNVNPVGNSVCVSIVDPTATYVPKINSNWSASKQISFYDADDELNSCFTKDDALMLINFIKRSISSNIDNIIVHCYGGISRSAAVAKFISDIFKLNFPSNYMLYNKYIYTTLANQYYYSELKNE